MFDFFACAFAYFVLTVASLFALGLVFVFFMYMLLVVAWRDSEMTSFVSRES